MYIYFSPEIGLGYFLSLGLFNYVFSDAQVI